MKRLLAIGILCGASTCLAGLSHAASYVYGGFSSSAAGATSLNQLYDDGLHGDGAAGDNIFGVDITVDKPAGNYLWVVAGPFGAAEGGLPYCWCTSTLTGRAQLWTTGPGDVIHFALDSRSRGWQPYPAIACDHCKPAGAPLQLVLDFSPTWPGTAYAASLSGSIWECVVTVPNARQHQYVFSTLDRTVIFTGSYNRYCGGGCQEYEEPICTFTTTLANSDVRFQFDEASGQMRAIVLGVTPAHSASWGSLKILYR